MGGKEEVKRISPPGGPKSEISFVGGRVLDEDVLRRWSNRRRVTSRFAGVAVVVDGAFKGQFVLVDDDDEDDAAAAIVYPAGMPGRCVSIKYSALRRATKYEATRWHEDYRRRWSARTNKAR